MTKPKKVNKTKKKEDEEKTTKSTTLTATNTKKTTRRAKEDKKEENPKEQELKGTARLSSFLSSLPGVRVENAADVRNSFNVRLPTGIMGLDIAIGGGIPRGGITELWGSAGAGKSSMCSMLMAQNQRIFGQESRIAVVGVEHELDKGLARKLGVKLAMSDSEIDRDEELYGITYSKEERFFMRNQQEGEISLLSCATAEDALEAVYRIISLDEYQLVIVDSIAQLLPKDEAGAPMANTGMLGAALPRAIARFNRKLTDAYFQRPFGRPNLTSLIVTNQVTAKIGGFTRPGMPPPETQKGGFSLRHAKFLSIKLRASKMDKVDPADGHTVNWAVDKGKAGTHNGMSGSFSYWKRPPFGPDYAEESFGAALDARVIEQYPGAFYACPKYGIDKVKGKAAMMAALQESNPEWYWDIYKEVMRANDIKTTLRWED